ncbi:MAG: HD-GYP domain-containing protein [bacterium]|nr:HD-GYP domain-containing protein [bacterium]
MKKKINIDQLQVGMYMEADVKESAQGAGSKNVLLLGKGVLIASDNQIRRLKAAGLENVTIDTTKGKDLPGGEVIAPVVIPQPQRERREKALPEGRNVPYRDELKMARKTKAVVTKALKGTLEGAAIGGAMDTQKIKVAGKLIAESVFRNVDAMVGLTRIKEHDAYTAAHCVNVCVLVLAVAHADGVDRSTAEMLATACLLHDIGKTKIPLEILNKPGRFEPHELAEMRKHTIYGEEVLRDMPGVTEEMMYIATQHHEMFNGSGYPHKLSGEGIHRFGQMTAVADVYDALTSARVYKPAMPPHVALTRIYGNRDTEFRSDIVDLFIKSLGLYPVGSLVTLDTEEVGIVCEPNPENSRLPKVGIFISRYGKRRIVPTVIDLADPYLAEKRKIVKVLDPTRYNLDIDKMLKMTSG